MEKKVIHDDSEPAGKVPHSVSQLQKLGTGAECCISFAIDLYPTLLSPTSIAVPWPVKVTFGGGFVTRSHTLLATVDGWGLQQAGQRVGC